MISIKQNSQKRKYKGDSTEISARVATRQLFGSATWSHHKYWDTCPTADLRYTKNAQITALQLSIVAASFCQLLLKTAVVPLHMI